MSSIGISSCLNRVAQEWRRSWKRISVIPLSSNRFPRVSFQDFQTINPERLEFHIHVFILLQEDPLNNSQRKRPGFYRVLYFLVRLTGFEPACFVAWNPKSLSLFRTPWKDWESLTGKCRDWLVSPLCPREPAGTPRTRWKSFFRCFADRMRTSPLPKDEAF